MARIRWSKPGPNRPHPNEVTDALMSLALLFPERSLGRLIHSAVEAQLGYWPGHLGGVTDEMLLKGFTALTPFEDEHLWEDENPDDDEENEGNE